MPTWYPQYEAAQAACRAVFTEKQETYGASWLDYRLLTAIDHILIKALRIRKLEELAAKGEAPKVDEGRAEEFIGIVNYAIIALLIYSHDDLQTQTEAALAARHEAALAETASLMLRKTSDYSDAWRVMAVTSFTDIIIVRVKRMKRLLETGASVPEGIDSQLMDTINYALFALITLKGDDTLV